MKKRILSGKGSVTKNERMPELKKPNYRNPGGLDKPRVVKPRTTPVPMPKRTPAGEPAVRRYNPKLEPGIKSKVRPGQSGPKKKSPSLGGMLTPKKGPSFIRVLPKRIKGTPVKRKMM